MAETPIVEVRGVTKRIGGKVIIDQLSFNVPRGEVFGFLGPNGAGKTTTIRMMVGLISMTQGDIVIGGHSINGSFEKAIAQVGAIVENPEMYKFLTGYQNLRHYARMVKGVSKQRIEEVIELVGLRNRIHEKVKKYSLGMRQRLGVAQALLHNPALLILDEPTNGLDPAGIRELRDYLRRLTKEEGISVLVSSHLLSEMELMCDRVAIIQNGKLIDVRLINEYADQSDLAAVRFEVDDAAMARVTIEASELNGVIRIEDGDLSMDLTREQVAAVNQILVRAGVKVYAIKTSRKTLEDKFLEMTGSEQIV